MSNNFISKIKDNIDRLVQNKTFMFWFSLFALAFSIAALLIKNNK